MAEFSPGKKLIFTYDDQGHPAMLNYNGNMYFYVTNQQGDVVGLRNETNILRASYKYNAWGELIDIQNNSSINVAYVNPLRYRGYYYDSETGFYYLNSRYYDPEICRFVNADGQLSTGSMGGMNLFAYCGNNPVNRVDPTGQFWQELWEFVKTAAVEIGQAISNVSPAYAGCGGLAVADGPLPFGDAVAIVGAVLLTIGAVGYGIYQATKVPTRYVSKVNEKEKSIIKNQSPRNGKTYYHVTTFENASSIITSGMMTGGEWEGGYIYMHGKESPTSMLLRIQGRIWV